MAARAVRAYIGAMAEDALYSLDLLTLAAGIPRVGALENPDATVRKVSKLCGSWLELDIKMDGDMEEGPGGERRVADAAVRLQACALGQAAASVLMRNIGGATAAELEQARDSLKAMLKQDGAPPQGRFAGLSALAEVKNYPQRHTSTLLAFEAAAEAARAASSPASSPVSAVGPDRKPG